MIEHLQKLVDQNWNTYEWLSKLNSIFYLQLCKIISSPAVSNIESAFKLI